MECRPDKNIIYYLTEEEYKIFERATNNWIERYTGKYSIEKCLKLCQQVDKILGWGLFNNIKTKVIKNSAQLKGKSANFIFVEETISKSKLRGLNKDLSMIDDFGIFGKELK